MFLVTESRHEMCASIFLLGNNVRELGRVVVSLSDNDKPSYYWHRFCFYSLF